MTLTPKQSDNLTEASVEDALLKMEEAAKSGEILTLRPTRAQDTVLHARVIAVRKAHRKELDKIPREQRAAVAICAAHEACRDAAVLLLKTMRKTGLTQGDAGAVKALTLEIAACIAEEDPAKSAAMNDALFAKLASVQ